MTLRVWAKSCNYKCDSLQSFFFFFWMYQLAILTHHCNQTSNTWHWMRNISFILCKNTEPFWLYNTDLFRHKIDLNVFCSCLNTALKSSTVQQIAEWKKSNEKSVYKINSSFTLNPKASSFSSINYADFSNLYNAFHLPTNPVFYKKTMTSCIKWGL